MSTWRGSVWTEWECRDPKCRRPWAVASLTTPHPVRCRFCGAPNPKRTYCGPPKVSGKRYELIAVDEATDGAKLAAAKRVLDVERRTA